MSTFAELWAEAGWGKAPRPANRTNPAYARWEDTHKLGQSARRQIKSRLLAFAHAGGIEAARQLLHELRDYPPAGSRLHDLLDALDRQPKI